MALNIFLHLLSIWAQKVEKMALGTCVIWQTWSFDLFRYLRQPAARPSCLIEHVFGPLACVFQVHLVAIFGVDSCFAVQSNMGSVRNSRCQFMLCLACGGSGVGASVQTAAAQTGGKKVAGTKTAKPPLKLASVQATAYLAQIYWSPPFCALLNLNNFAKANKVFCRFWCLGQRDANIEGVAV